MTNDLMVNIAASAAWSIIGALGALLVYRLRRISRYRRAGAVWRHFMDNAVVVVGRQVEISSGGLFAPGVVGASELLAITYLSQHLEGLGARQVMIRFADQLSADDWESNLIFLGGNDWNTATVEAMRRLHTRIIMSAEPYYQVLSDGRRAQGDQELLITQPQAGVKRLRDWGLIVFATNPMNRRSRIMVLCGGLGYGVQISARRAVQSDFLGQEIVRTGGDFAESFRFEIDGDAILPPYDFLMGSL